MWLRRRVHAGLDKGEAPAQRDRASGLNLMAVAAALWNTVYLVRAAHGLRGNGRAVGDALLQYLSPPGCEHINLTGDYAWRSGAR